MHIVPDKTNGFHLSGCKALFSLLFGASGTIIAAIIIFEVAAESVSLASLAIPFFFMAIFCFYTADKIIMLFQLERPVIEVGPDGILDHRQMNASVPWVNIRHISTRRSRQVWYVTLYLETTENLQLRVPYRWFRNWPKLRDYGDIAIPAAGLTVSQDAFKSAIEEIAKAHGAPAAKDWY